MDKKRDRIEFFDKKDFGGNKLKALKRDNYCCQKCWMTNAKHLKKYGRRITVDHKDRNRNNNDLKNLETLCLGCHGAKDVFVRPVLQFDMNGKFIQRFQSIAEAGRAVKCNGNNIGQHIAGKFTHARGFKWQYA